jgi:4-alpha-glucanotransferase
VTSAIDVARAELGIDRLVFAIHGASFPADPGEDIGRGAPATRAGERLFAFVRSLGFTALQLGPGGQTTPDNASPYDATIFSRDVTAIPLSAFADLVAAEAIVRATDRRGGTRADHRRAHAVVQALLDDAYEAFATGGHPDLAPRLAAFQAAHASWLPRDGLYAALRAHHGGAAFRHWPDALDRELWLRTGEDVVDRRERLFAHHVREIERYSFAQLLAHDAHERVRAICRGHGLALYGDLQVGISDCDGWVHAAAFLPDYVMGAPPSRTNPEGQPWGYAVLDPVQYASGPARAFVRARLASAFAAYDSLRIDHPHGWVCPWVYRADAADPARAVRDGARLFESPEHPALARFAIARVDQIDPTKTPYADDRVTALDDGQVARYAALFDVIAETAAAHGRAVADLSPEVLSTLPVPLARVLARHHLGRWRVLPKADLANRQDVYRAENAAPEDWVMLGNHDTAPIFVTVAAWSATTRETWARHLAARLSLSPDDTARLATDDGFVATSMLAELFACAARSVSIFWADLFGETERYNEPGTYHDRNWTLRLPADFESVYRERLARGRALDLARAIELARHARSLDTRREA